MRQRGLIEITRCVEFYDYWDEHPDFCGKSSAIVSQINSYSKVLKELKELGVERSFAIANFPENNARPIFPLKDPIRTQVLKNVASWLLTNRKPSQADVKTWTSLYTAKRPECKEPEPCKLDVKKIGKCTCEYYDAILPGCIRTFPRLCPSSPEQRKQEGCNLEGMQPPQPSVPPTPTAATVAAIAHVPVESVLPIRGPRPSDRTGPFTPANEIRKGLVDLNTPDTRTAPQTFTPPRPIERTDPNDKANGVVKQQVSAVHIPDLKVIPVEIRRAELQVIAQMVMYGVEDTEKAAAERMMREGRVICEDLCEQALNNQVEDEDSFEEVEA